MPIKLKSLAADLNKERDGEWIDIAEWPGVRLKVRSIHYPEFSAALAQASRQLQRQFGEKPVPEAKSAEVNGRLYAEHLLVEWQGFDEPYSQEAALQALTDPAYRELRAQVAWAASQVGRGQVEFVKDAEGN